MDFSSLEVLRPLLAPICSRGQEAFPDRQAYFQIEALAHLQTQSSLPGPLKPVKPFKPVAQTSEWDPVPRDSWASSESLLNWVADDNPQMSARWKSNVKVPRSFSAAQLIHCDCFYGWSRCIQYVKLHLRGVCPPASLPRWGHGPHQNALEQSCRCLLLAQFLLTYSHSVRARSASTCQLG